MHFTFDLTPKGVFNGLRGILTVFLLIQAGPVLAVDSISPYSKISVSEIVDRYVANDDYRNGTNLCSIMTSHGSDKGNYHNYTTLYSQLFNEFRNDTLNIFELGLGTNNIDVPSNMGIFGIPGASLRGWADYFPNSQIYGADIDDRILFQEGSISTFYCDQRDKKSIEDMFSNDLLKDVPFDIIIEDGLHEFEANLTFLMNSIKHLKQGGIYIIEDLLPIDASKFEQIIPELRKEFRCVVLLKLPTDNAPLKFYDDNTLLIIQK